jgi:hypothetical protein
MQRPTSTPNAAVKPCEYWKKKETTNTQEAIGHIHQLEGQVQGNEMENVVKKRKNRARYKGLIITIL